MTGSEVSPGRLLENRIVQTQILHGSLVPPVLLLQFLEPSGLLYSLSSVLPRPSVVCLFRNPKFAADFARTAMD